MINIKNPYDLKNGFWIKGNLHTHSTRSDGTLSPQDVIDAYAKLGYGFLAFSDHDVIITENDYKKLNNNGLVLISGTEISADGPHLLYIDCEKDIIPSPQRQEVFNRINEIFKQTGHGFAVVNHPNWQSQFDHCTIEQMTEWVGYLGMEIYNGTICRLDGSPYALNKWDILLSLGKKIWGFANDDSHRQGEIGIGWNVVFTSEKSSQAIVDAIIKGNFYCSTGVVIKDIRCNGERVYLETENAKKIAAVCNVGRRFSVSYSSSIEVEIPVNTKYVRFECWGEAEQMAWTQPIFISVEKTFPEEDYLSQWLISDLLDIESLDKASPSDAIKFARVPISCQPAGTALSGFVDTREKTNLQKGIVYLVSEVNFEKQGKALLSLGYDGPIRVWINGKEVFYGPGTNPAIKDQTKVYTNVQKGKNQIVIAFDTNGGKAWGIFCKIKQVM
ncbi:MAG TPA: CehA/McbA family metallohydrolase [Candidatus Ratteibacteria bacterium]|nr:CehA/McbA family metallohydrolase [Candidatus Ratteibacteria bacterium]